MNTLIHIMGKNSGYLVTTKKGLKGRTYHKDGTINGKVPVYIDGQKNAILCDVETLEMNGFID